MKNEYKLVTVFEHAIRKSEGIDADQTRIASCDWEHLKSLPPKQLLQSYRTIVAQPNYCHVKNGLRAFSAYMLERQLISMDGYVSVFGGQAANYLSVGKDNRFYDMKNAQDATSLAHIYSRAKYGSIMDIRFLADVVIAMLSKALDDPCSHWRKLFTTARGNGDNVVLMTTGWRNVPSTANVLYDIVVEHINLKLAHMELPTIINVKLARIAPPCENYASLSPEERERVNLVQDHIIPDKNFYQWSGVHVIFGDDVLVTGATADKVYFESICNGAKTFQSIYPIAIDPVLALHDAAIEERLNMVAVKGDLDDVVATFLSHAGYQPILRTLRLLFNKQNYPPLTNFLLRVPVATWLKLYVSALGNDFFRKEECIDSLTLLKDYLTKAGLLDCNGMMTTSR